MRSNLGLQITSQKKEFFGIDFFLLSIKFLFAIANLLVVRRYKVIAFFFVVDERPCFISSCFSSSKTN